MDGLSPTPTIRRVGERRGVCASERDKIGAFTIWTRGWSDGQVNLWARFFRFILGLISIYGIENFPILDTCDRALPRDTCDQVLPRVLKISAVNP